jgi:hypothetical protein
MIYKAKKKPLNPEDSSNKQLSLLTNNNRRVAGAVSFVTGGLWDPQFGRIHYLVNDFHFTANGASE